METPELAPHHRIVFDDLKSMSTRDNRSVVTVYLTGPDGESFEGTCEDKKSPTPPDESATTAVLRALEAAAEGRVAFALWRVVEISELNTVLVHLSITTPVGDNVQLLNGAGFVNGHPLHAAVKATLQATNRVFETGFMFIH